MLHAQCADVDMSLDEVDSANRIVQDGPVRRIGHQRREQVQRIPRVVHLHFGFRHGGSTNRTGRGMLLLLLERHGRFARRKGLRSGGKRRDGRGAADRQVLAKIIRFSFARRRWRESEGRRFRSWPQAARCGRRRWNPNVRYARRRARTRRSKHRRSKTRTPLAHHSEPAEKIPFLFFSPRSPFFQGRHKRKKKSRRLLRGHVHACRAALGNAHRRWWWEAQCGTLSSARRH
jgi:hypothetical protein